VSHWCARSQRAQALCEEHVEIALVNPDFAMETPELTSRLMPAIRRVTESEPMPGRPHTRRIPPTSRFHPPRGRFQVTEWVPRASHIEDIGGAVLLAASLTGKGYGAKIALSDGHLAQLRERYGSIEPWWRDTFGYGFDGFTESEARFVLTLRDRPGSDALRARVAAARVRSVGGVGEGNDSDGRDRPPLARCSRPATDLHLADVVRRLPEAASHGAIRFAPAAP
jgi:hypothetical protein